MCLNTPILVVFSCSKKNHKSWIIKWGMVVILICLFWCPKVWGQDAWHANNKMQISQDLEQLWRWFFQMYVPPFCSFLSQYLHDWCKLLYLSSLRNVTVRCAFVTCYGTQFFVFFVFSLEIFQYFASFGWIWNFQQFFWNILHLWEHIQNLLKLVVSFSTRFPIPVMPYPCCIHNSSIHVHIH